MNNSTGITCIKQINNTSLNQTSFSGANYYRELVIEAPSGEITFFDTSELHENQSVHQFIKEWQQL